MHWRSGHKNDCRQLVNPSEASVILGNGKGNPPAMDKGKQRLWNINSFWHYIVKAPFLLHICIISAACKTLWPEYEIGIEDECSFDSELSEDTSSATSLVPVQNKTDEAFQSLSDKFEVFLFDCLSCTFSCPEHCHLIFILLLGCRLTVIRRVGHLFNSALLRPPSKCWGECFLIPSPFTNLYFLFSMVDRLTYHLPCTCLRSHFCFL